MRILKRISNPKNNNSVLYLALLCLLYLLFTSNYLQSAYTLEPPFNSKNQIAIEISKDGISTIKVFDNSKELSNIESKYNLSRNLKSGDKIIFNGNGIEVASISGQKMISLGVPIRINSASQNDLIAIPGIGKELASRIIEYRSTHGNFKNIDDLDNIEGIGRKKLAAIKKVAKID